MAATNAELTEQLKTARQEASAATQARDQARKDLDADKAKLEALEAENAQLKRDLEIVAKRAEDAEAVIAAIEAAPDAPAPQGGLVTAGADGAAR